MRAGITAMLLQNKVHAIKLTAESGAAFCIILIKAIYVKGKRGEINFKSLELSNSLERNKFLRLKICTNIIQFHN